MGSGVRRSVIEGVGSYLPARIMSNADLARMVDTSDEWIVERTGIRERRIAAEKETTGDLAINAARDALVQSGTRADEIDLIIVATSTPDNTFPATAVKVQAALGIVQGSAFDLQAVCSGFVYGLTVADSLLKAGQGSCALIITDRGTCVLFGDGAAAVVLRANGGEGTIADRGILAARLRSDGRYKDKLYVDGGVSSTMTVGHLRMEGREVFKHAVVNIATIMADTIKDAGLQPKDIDWFVPHQANRRILEGTAKKLGVTEERVVMTLDKHGNTSAASIPLALDTAVKDGRIQRGDLVLMEAMGGGFTWGAVLVRW
ncbi:MAG: ketoacyl-ACP synthase III [Alphaproteobacteria bacterium]|nr:MAG: ketoacyl-ACP synthase III [Alphaproteobacteria bacterium]